MKTTVTVEVDERGRFTVPEPARRVVTLSERRSRVRLEIRVLEPEDAKGKTAETTATVDDRGRVTISPSSVRNELGIRDREAICEVTVSKTRAGERQS